MKVDLDILYLPKILSIIKLISYGVKTHSISNFVIVSLKIYLLLINDKQTKK
jgi:hypothetical protein